MLEQLVVADRSRTRKADGTCIIHKEDSNRKNFVYLANLKNTDAKLKFLQGIRDKRRRQPYESLTRMEDTCAMTPKAHDKEKDYGYHRDCYSE